MAAYAKRFDRRICSQSPCPLTATHAVYNTYNDHMGDYCEKHARLRVIELNTRFEAAPLAKEWTDAASD